jgi:hypothetical protein
MRAEDVKVGQMTFTMGSNNDIGLGEISASLAVLGIVIYALGLVALSWPIYRRITGDATTALYAVSLMPKTVVVGQGVRLLFGLPLVITTLWVSIGVVSRIAQNIFTSFSSSYSVWVQRGGSFLVVIVIIGLGFYLISRMSAIWEAVEVQGGSPWATVFSFAFAVVMGIVTGLVVINVFFDQGAILPQWPGWTSTLKTLMLLFLLNSVIGFALALAGEPPLPGIGLNGSTTPEGKLVAHSDGVWYVLDDNGKLVGIPDDNAGKVFVIPT